MPFYHNGELVGGPRGPSGPDGNPIGTIISFMGTTPPKDYLICDGKWYKTYEYPELASFFQEQFGDVHYFGGSNLLNFAVPDLRNLFLRGYHGEAEEQLSGEVGVRQEATEFPYLIVGGGSSPNGYVGFSNSGGHTATVTPENVDYKDSPAKIWQGTAPGSAPMADLDDYPAAKKLYGNFYTSRPVNTAVLFCIKAVESAPASPEEVYSTEEQCIGQWLDGKPLYRKVFYFEDVTISGRNSARVADCSDLNIHEVLSISGTYNYDTDPRRWKLGGQNTDAYYGTADFIGGIGGFFYNYRSDQHVFSGVMILEYTKTTD